MMVVMVVLMHLLRYNILKHLDLDMSVFTTDISSTFFHVVPMFTLNFKSTCDG